MRIQSFLILILLAVFYFSIPVHAYEIDDVQWDSVIDSKTMHWGDTVKYGEYTIEVSDFADDGSVYVNLYKNGDLVKHAPLKVGNSLEYRDVEDGNDMKVYAKKVSLNIDEWTDTMEDPTADIQVYRRGFPEFDISIETDKDTYDPRTASAVDGIKVMVYVENDGEADADDVTLTISGAELKDGKLVHKISSLDIDETSETYKVKLNIPLFWEETDIDITATVEGYDINNDLHTKTESEEVTINPKSELLITKSAVKEAYMGDNIRVQVSISNWGSYPISGIHVEDYLNDNFEILDSDVLKADLSLDPDESKVIFDYTLKPLNDGKHKLPDTVATFTVDGKTYTVESEETEIQVDGPVIEVSQSISDSNLFPGESSTVKVVVKNSGNRDASIHFSSEVPEGLAFVSGDLVVDQVLKDGKSVSYSYVVKATENGTFTIPAAEGNFIDMEDYKGEMISNSLSLVVGEQGKSDSISTSTNNDSDDPILIPNDDATDSENNNSSADNNKIEPGFGILSGISIIGLLYIGKRYRKI